MSDFLSFLKQIESNHVHKKILLVCDIDDTLIRPKIGSKNDNVIGLGSDTWFSLLLKNDKNFELNIVELLRQLDMVYSMLDYCYVEPMNTNDVVSYINTLSESKDLNFNYLLMTSRSPNYAQHTVRHLKSVGSDTVFVRKNMLDVENCLYMERDEKKNQVSVRYIDNICFTSGGNKGKILNDMLIQDYVSNENYDVIIYIDDIARHVDSMHDNFINTSIYQNTNTYCLHYQYLETHKKQYTMDHFASDCKKLEKLIALKNYLNEKTDDIVEN